MSHWLASLLTTTCHGLPTTSLVTFKQVCGLLCEVTTRLLSGEPQNIDTVDVADLYREVTLLYLQCTVQDDESLVRIGNSCLRYISIIQLINYKSYFIQIFYLV